ncbi:hypothetical protein [Roseomonas sp. BN140053]|uniref:hypothetical protein n=1 Tax=Roseomonas sp. BN140053 TaxID=3391898 RepID=UPI0039ED0342
MDCTTTTDEFVAALYDPEFTVEIARWYQAGEVRPAEVGYTVRIWPPPGNLTPHRSHFGALRIHDQMATRGFVDAHMRTGHRREQHQFGPMDRTIAGALWVLLKALGNEIRWDKHSPHVPPGARFGFSRINRRVNMAMVNRLIDEEGEELQRFSSIWKLHDPKWRRLYWDNDAWEALGHRLFGAEMS